MGHRNTLLAMLIATPAIAIDGNAQAHDLVIHDPWVREVPPVADDSAGYLRIENRGDNDATLIDGESEQFERVELHESIEEDGTMRMHHHDEVVVPAGGDVAMEPGGYHVMLIGRQGDPLQEGDNVTFTLRLADGNTVNITAPVMRYGPDGDADDDMDHHDHH